MKQNILDVARVIRSKNSGPYELTLDIMFKGPEYYKAFKDKKIINRKVIADLYGIAESKILKIVWFEPSNAVKITMKRPVVSGSPGETDIYGAQQHAPLLGICFPSGLLGRGKQ